MEYSGSAHSTCNLKIVSLEKILKALHNESNYDYHFNIKETAKKIKNNLFA